MTFCKRKLNIVLIKIKKLKLMVYSYMKLTL